MPYIAIIGCRPNLIKLFVGAAAPDPLRRRKHCLGRPRPDLRRAGEPRLRPAGAWPPARRTEKNDFRPPSPAGRRQKSGLDFYLRRLLCYDKRNGG